jgi:pantetheine-phosphate adenylyltransferase|tara:strand:- start:1407 stop:1886 length:480 start_codon:yes stop_codon:yes gene_type:complete
MKTAIYPGTFDPVTNGHLDVLERASKLFPKVIIAVSENSEKKTLFDLEERMFLIKKNVLKYNNVFIGSFKGLLVEYALEQNASVIIRGLRAVSDFEYEFQMAQMNRHLEEDLETLFLMPNEKYFFTSSTLVKQVMKYTDRPLQLIPSNVLEALKKKLHN